MHDIFYFFQGAESLLHLIELAKERIPRDKWSSTPLVLKATAGLRLLPTDKADALLLEVKCVHHGINYLFIHKIHSYHTGKASLI